MIRFIVTLDLPKVSWDEPGMQEIKRSVQRACEHSLDLIREEVTVASVEFDPVQPIPF
jgi:hypothetical protein